MVGDMYSTVAETRKKMDKMLIFFKIENRPYYIKGIKGSAEKSSYNH